MPKIQLIVFVIYARMKTDNWKIQMKPREDFSLIKVILWDIDGTLLNFKMSERYAIEYCFNKFHMGTCTDEMLQRYSVINRGYWERLETGELTREQVMLGRFHEFLNRKDCRRIR